MTAHHEHEHHTPEMPSHLDSWHQHPSSEGVPREEHGAHANVTALLITFVVITVGTVIFSVIIGVYAIGHVSRLKTEGEAAGLAAMAAGARQYKETALAEQTGYGWTAEGKVRLPIEQAMRMVVDQYGESQGQ